MTSRETNEQTRSTSMAYESFIRTGSFVVNHPPDRVFPLICPKREEEWIPGWSCEVLASQSGFAEVGAVFRTTEPYGGELVWATAEHDAARGVVEFVNHSPQRFVFFFRIELRFEGAGARLTFTQRFCPVSDEGAVHVAEFRKEDFRSRLDRLGQLIDAHLGGINL